MFQLMNETGTRLGEATLAAWLGAPSEIQVLRERQGAVKELTALTSFRQELVARAHVAAFVVHPRAVDRTRVECHLLFAAAEAASPRFDPSDAVELWDLVNNQDWAVCESVQRGMSSRAYTHGWFAPMEDDSADIRRWLLPRLLQRLGADGVGATDA